MFGVIKKGGVTFLVGFLFAMLCFIGINAAMEPASTSEFCGSQCHEMNTAYRTWELSVHGANNRGITVGCIDCHLPSKDDYFTHLVTKAYEGGKDLYKHYFGGPYDVQAMSEKVLAHMDNQICLRCHNSLLTKPGSSIARMSHLEVLNRPDESKIKCIDCHEDVAHQRQSKLFSP